MAVRFKAEEFPELGGHDMTDNILDAYNYKPAGRPRPRPIIAPRTLDESTSFASAKSGAEEHVNVIIPRKAPKKTRRVALDRTMGGPMGATIKASQPMSNGGSQGGGGGAGASGRAPLQRPIPAPPSRPVSADPFAAEELPLTEDSGSAATARMFEGAHRAFGSDLKRKALDDEYNRPAKGRTMGTSRSLAAPQEIRAPHVVFASTSGSAHTLSVPTIQNVQRVQLDDGIHALTASNSENLDDPEDLFGTMVTYADIKENKDVWVDFLSSPILAIAATLQISAIACEDCSIHICSTASGRK
jgi:hypothetical protein